MNDEDLKDFGQFDKIVGALLHDLTPIAQRQRLREIGRAIRREQAARIAAGKESDGEAFKPRKRVRDVRTKHAMKFLYPSNGGGKPRLVYMKSWTYQGKGQVTGFDIKAGAQRTFDRDKIIRFIPLDPGEDVGGAGTLKRPNRRQKAMFRKLRLPRYLRDWLDGNELNIGFRGRGAQAARWHQEGQGNRPVRRLLGWSRIDENEIMDRIFARLDKKF